MLKLYEAFWHPAGPVFRRMGSPYSRISLDEPGWHWWYRRNGEHLGGGSRMKRVVEEDGVTYGFKRIPYASQQEAQAQADRDKVACEWYVIWQRAFDNVPPRVKYEQCWQPQEFGATKLVEYIKGRARKTHRVVGGVVEINKPKRIEYGRASALCRILNMTLSEKSRHPGVANTNWLFNAKNAGAVPRDPARRELVLALAGPEGRKIAIAKLTELGIINRYEV